MKVTILEPFGYCSGVELAIKLALKTKQENPDKNVVVLGMLVHNEDTLIALEKHEISTIYEKNSSLEELIEKIDRPSIVILTAHGHSKKVEDKLILNGHTIVDATCPFVNKSFTEIKNEIAKKNDILYIGVKNHPESNAALSLSRKIKLIDIKDPKIPSVCSKKPLVVTQTTLSENEVSGIYQLIKKTYPEAILNKGVCHASTMRQKAILNIDKDVDKIFVVGGVNSNNSKTLYNLAKTTYPNINIELVQNSDNINKKDLKGLSHIVISSGASTPKEVIESIKNKLLN